VKSRLIVVPFGVAFGFLISWAHLTDASVIRAMLLLREPDVFLLMGSAMMVGAAGLHLLRATGVRTWTRTSPTRDHVIGSAIFGLGWGLANTCPAPIAAQLGAGRFAALFLAGGLLAGVALRGWQQTRALGAPAGSAL
jgi:uncharacterized membrane protein YedE/YeeE